MLISIKIKSVLEIVKGNYLWIVDFSHFILQSAYLLTRKIFFGQTLSLQIVKLKLIKLMWSLIFPRAKFMPFLYKCIIMNAIIANFILIFIPMWSLYNAYGQSVVIVYKIIEALLEQKATIKII